MRRGRTLRTERFVTADSEAADGRASRGGSLCESQNGVRLEAQLSTRQPGLKTNGRRFVALGTFVLAAIRDESMLSIVELREGTWSPMLAVSPREYLARRSRDEIQKRNAAAVSIAKSGGLRQVYTDTTIRTDVSDTLMYRRFLEQNGATRTQADAEIARFPMEQDFKELIDAMDLTSAQCLQNTGEHRERLASVPVGACPNPYLNAGAGPVIPGTGDIALLNFGLHFLARWYPSVIVARGCEPTQLEGETVLVLRQVLMLGYSEANLMRASSIVNCQSTPRCFSLVAADHASVSARSNSMSSIRRPFKH